MRGLLAIEPLYHKIVAGEKIQTRRSGGLDEVNEHPDQWCKPYLTTRPPNKIECHFLRKHEFLTEKDPGKAYNKIDVPICKARYHIGEVLYLKEPYIFLESDKVDFWNGFAYKFGAREGTATSERGCELGGPEFKFKNKLFMPASAARQFVNITGIRCERLLNISDEDCIAEGIEYKQPDITDNVQVKRYFDYKENKFLATAPQASFLSLFKFANKVKEVPNLWVWVYEFEYLKNYKP